MPITLRSSDQREYLASLLPQWPKMRGPLQLHETSSDDYAAIARLFERDVRRCPHYFLPVREQQRVELSASNAASECSTARPSPDVNIHHTHQSGQKQTFLAVQRQLNEQKLRLVEDLEAAVKVLEEESRGSGCHEPVRGASARLVRNPQLERVRSQSAAADRSLPPTSDMPPKVVGANRRLYNPRLVAHVDPPIVTKRERFPHELQHEFSKTKFTKASALRMHDSTMAIKKRNIALLQAKYYPPPVTPQLEKVSIGIAANRMSTAEMKSRATHLAALERKYLASPATEFSHLTMPRETLSATDVQASAARLHDSSVAHLRKTMKKLARTYAAGDKSSASEYSMFATEHERQLCSQRLYGDALRRRRDAQDV